MSVKPMAGFDMDNRDPNNLNEHLQVSLMPNTITIFFFKVLFFLIGHHLFKVKFTELTSEQTLNNIVGLKIILNHHSFQQNICNIVLRFEKMFFSSLDV